MVTENIKAHLSFYIKCTAFLSLIEPTSNQKRSQAIEEIQPTVSDIKTFCMNEGEHKTLRPSNAGSKILDWDMLYLASTDISTQVYARYEELMIDEGFEMVEGMCPRVKAQEMVEKAKRNLAKSIEGITLVKYESIQTTMGRDLYLAKSLALISESLNFGSKQLPMSKTN